MPLQSFRAFSILHAGILAAFFVGVGTLLLARWRLTHRSNVEGDEAPRGLDRSLGLLAAAAWVFSIGTDLVPSRFDIGGSLPLQLCDIAGLIAPIALLTDRRWARALLHYWGLGLSTQAMITPTLTDGPATLEFWCFWAAHTAVVGSAIYDFLGRGFRPAWRDLQVAAICTAAYMPLALAVDLPLGVNYGFVGNTHPDRPTVLDLLGPWPERLFSIWVLVGLLLFGMTWPWELWRWIQQQRALRRRWRQAPPAFSVVQREILDCRNDS